MPSHGTTSTNICVRLADDEHRLTMRENSAQQMYTSIVDVKHPDEMNHVNISCLFIYHFAQIISTFRDVCCLKAGDMTTLLWDSGSIVYAPKNSVRLELQSTDFKMIKIRQLN